MGGRQKDLSTGPTQNLEEPTIAAPVELARYVVEQQNRHAPGALAQQGELRGLQRQDDRAVLPLRAVMTSADLVYPELEIVSVWTVGREPPRKILAKRTLERVGNRTFRWLDPRQIPDRQRGITSEHFAERANHARSEVVD
jgi:hypothetical protein